MNDDIRIKVSWCHERGEALPLPSYESRGASGLDIRSAVNILIQPFERKKIPTGLRVSLPEGYELQVRARSGLSLRQGLTVVNGVGTIDSDYRGEIHVLVVNLSQKVVQIMRGDRFAQLVLQQVPRIQWELVTEAEHDESVRKEGGFGSTGVN